LTEIAVFFVPSYTAPPEDGLIEAETYRRVIVDDQLLFIIDDAICWK